MNNIADLGFNIEPKVRPGNCETHGPFESRCFIGSIWSKCPACSAAEEAESKAKRESKEREEKAAAWRRKMGNAGIPERFQNRSLQSFVAETEAQAKALDFAIGYADNFDSVLETGKSAIFVGKPGTGKTHLAVGIGLRIVHRDNRTVLFTTVLRAIRRIKETWGLDSAETETEAINALALPDLLILDEVGVQFGSETEKNLLFDVLNERYEKRRPTLILSNLTVDGVKAHLGERVFDRLREDGGEAIPFDWSSYRGRSAA